MICFKRYVLKRNWVRWINISFVSVCYTCVYRTVATVWWIIQYSPSCQFHFQSLPKLLRKISGCLATKCSTTFQLVTDCVSDVWWSPSCLLWVYQSFCLKLPAVDRNTAMRVVRMNQTSTVVHKQKCDKACLWFEGELQAATLSWPNNNWVQWMFAASWSKIWYNSAGEGA